MALAGQVDAARRLHETGRVDEARVAYERVLRADAGNAAAWSGLGELAEQRDARDAALKMFAKAAALAPGDADVRARHARALQEREDFDAAAVELRAACAARGGDAALWEGLGIVEQASGNTDAAVAAYERAVALEPTPARRVKVATAISPIPPSLDAIAHERARMGAVLDGLLAEPALAPVGDPFDARLWTNFYLAYHGENDRELQEKTAAVYRRICPSLDFVAAHCARPRRPGRLRVGLISNFLRNHSIGRTSRGLFARLSRDAFEVTAVFVAPAADDDYSRAIRRDAEHHVVLPRDFGRAREQLAALELDVLFYQDLGMEPFTYFLSYARLARVQCVSFGHPDTTGVPAVDWFVSNDRYEPPHAQAHYSEKLFELHGLGTLAYYYRPQLPRNAKRRGDFGLPSDRPLYLCPQNLFKVHPDMDALIAAILRRDPRGVVAFVEGRADNWTRLLRARWRRTLPDVAARIVFLPRQNEHDFLALIACADVMLDTVHFNGMNTSLEAFALGVPVVTLPAALQRGRHTQAMYAHMGLEDQVARDADDYAGRAVRLGTDRAHRDAVSRRILERCGALFEDAAVVREFERFFREVAAG